MPGTLFVIAENFGFWWWGSLSCYGARMEKVLRASVCHSRAHPSQCLRARPSLCHSRAHPSLCLRAHPSQYLIAHPPMCHLIAHPPMCHFIAHSPPSVSFCSTSIYAPFHSTSASVSFRGASNLVPCQSALRHRTISQSFFIMPKWSLAYKNCEVFRPEKV